MRTYFFKYYLNCWKIQNYLQDCIDKTAIPNIQYTLVTWIRFYHIDLLFIKVSMIFDSQSLWTHPLIEDLFISSQPILFKIQYLCLTLCTYYQSCIDINIYAMIHSAIMMSMIMHTLLIIIANRHLAFQTNVRIFQFWIANIASYILFFM